VKLARLSGQNLGWKKKNKSFATNFLGLRHQMDGAKNRAKKKKGSGGPKEVGGARS